MVFSVFFINQIHFFVKDGIFVRRTLPCVLWKPDNINILFSLFNHFEQSIFFLLLLMTKCRQICRPHTFISLDGLNSFLLACNVTLEFLMQRNNVSCCCQKENCKYMPFYLFIYLGFNDWIMQISFFYTRETPMD